MYSELDPTKNNAINWSLRLDNKKDIGFVPYYSTQQEMLARTVEKMINKHLKGFSDTITTPSLNQEERQNFIAILKIWHDTISEISKPQTLSNKISTLRRKIDDNPELIKKLKI